MRQVASRAFLILRTSLTALIVVAAFLSTPDWARTPSSTEPLPETGEHVMEDLARFHRSARAERQGTLGVIESVRHRRATGWEGERIWHRSANDWEPALAADPSSRYVYQVTTRYGRRCDGCPSPWIVFRSSADGGTTWSRDRPLCRCSTGWPQYDPQIEVASDGTVHAVWVEGLSKRLAFTSSIDHGQTWSKPRALEGHLGFADKPVLALSRDGSDVYVAFNAGHSYVVASHDGGRTFSRPIRTNDGNRYYTAGGGYVAPDGTVLFAQASYHPSSQKVDHDPPRPRPVLIEVATSRDGGRTWSHDTVESFAAWEACSSRSCPEMFYGPQATVAGDARGRVVLVSNGALRSGGDQRVFVRRSPDAGRTWSRRRGVSPADSVGAFPAVAGTGHGDFRLWFMDDRNGADSWNVWYRRSTDGGRSWGRPHRISDAISGTAYKSSAGFREPYGDYGDVAILSSGAAIAVWGEGDSFAGPGGSWYNRER